MSAFQDEREAGRAAMPDRDAEISQEAARAMLAALRRAHRLLPYAAATGNRTEEVYATLRAIEVAVDMGERCFAERGA